MYVYYKCLTTKTSSIVEVSMGAHWVSGGTRRLAERTFRSQFFVAGKHDGFELAHD